MATSAELIKERLNIVDIIRAYVQLEKAGGNFRARCPFHNEKTPSFFISPGRQSYHCFGCNRGGDVFTFIQEIEGLDFSEALHLLADRAGIEIPKDNRVSTGPSTSEKDYFVRVLEIATRYFEKRLTEQSIALQYLQDRGVSSETIKRFRLGFAPDGWRNLVDFCSNQKIKLGALEKVGLALENPRKANDYYDRFRSRLMFPISDREGKVIGFSGRIFSTTTTKVEEAKYVNTPQTLLYDKSKALYGYHLAKNAIRETATVVLVEGQMDLIMSHQAGVQNTVAVSGTALTSTHLSLLKRLADKIVMAFDSDTAGVKASLRAVAMALEMGFQVRVALLPLGQDPADVVRENPQAWQQAVTEAIHVIDFYLVVIDREAEDVHGKSRRIREDVYPLLGALAHKVDQAYFVQKIAEKLQISEEAIWHDLRTVTAMGQVSNLRGESLQLDKLDNLTSSSRLEKVEQRLVGLLWALEEKKSPDLNPFYNKVVSLWSKDYVDMLSAANLEKKDSLLLEIDLLYEGKSLILEGERLVRELQELKLRQELSVVTKLLKEAESRREGDLVDKYMKKCQDISKSITDLISQAHA